MNEDSIRKLEHSNAHVYNNALSIATSSSPVGHDTHISDLNELRSGIKKIIESQQQQKSIGETCKTILQQMLSIKDELPALHDDIKQLQRNGEETSFPLDMFNENLRVLAEELKLHNAENRESILNLKVRVQH